VRQYFLLLVLLLISCSSGLGIDKERSMEDKLLGGWQSGPLWYVFFEGGQVFVGGSSSVIAYETDGNKLIFKAEGQSVHFANITDISDDAMTWQMNDPPRVIPLERLQDYNISANPEEDIVDIWECGRLKWEFQEDGQGVVYESDTPTSFTYKLTKNLIQIDDSSADPSLIYYIAGDFLFLIENGKTDAEMCQRVK
jgi:hypothetical protein